MHNGQSPTAQTAAWWKDPALRSCVNGVFKGGGAKGIIYTGALLEVRASGYWFRAAAGSSAGAITRHSSRRGLPLTQWLRLFRLDCAQCAACSRATSLEALSSAPSA
jgi:hypothetical protein